MDLSDAGQSIMVEWRRHMRAPTGMPGIAFTYEVARSLESDMTVFRTTDSGDGSGSLSNKYGQVAGKRVIIIDDVLSSGVTMSKTIDSIREAGGEVVLAIVLVNKTTRNEIEDVPLRGLIRAVAV